MIYYCNRNLLLVRSAFIVLYIILIYCQIDLVILGSVCVSHDGYRLGKGKGFADLEFAMMMRMGAVTQDTIVITTVHDCQVFDSLPAEIFKEYDVPVDIIVTPTQTIIVNPKLKKPSCIMWHMLSDRRIKSMPVLQQLKEMDEKYALKDVIDTICLRVNILNCCVFFFFFLEKAK